MKVSFYINREKSAAAGRHAELSAMVRKFGLAEVDDGGEIVIAIGGDGTILRAVHEFRGLPVLGLNCGGLGYLSAVGEDEFEFALKALAENRFTISERRLIEVNGRFAALNDIVVTRENSGHSVLLDLKADDSPVTRYMADGLIFATPTGSTAYSLAAGGPVMMPDSSCFVVTPLNPHALGVRPLVVRDTTRFSVTARARTAGNALKIGVYADGENVLRLDEGDTITIAASDKTAKLIELEGRDPYVVLARKLGFSGSNVR